MTALSKVFGGGKKTPALPPQAGKEVTPTGVTRAEQLIASRRRSRGGRDGSRSLMTADRLGPGPGEYETRDQIIQRTKDTLG